MKINEIKKIKENMGEIEFYQYFYFDGDRDFMEENIKRFRESEELLQTIYCLLQNEIDGEESSLSDYKVELFEGSLSITNKKTKNSYSVGIEF